MVQYLLTALAGLAVGLVAMRLWMSREPGTAGSPADDATAAPQSGKAAPSLASSRNLLIGAGVLAVLGIGVFLLRPVDDEGDAPSPATAVASDGLADVDTMISRLAERLKTDTDDGEGFRMLGWSYVMTGRPQEAIAPYERALELLPDNATVHAGYGEALVGVAGGTVTDAAKAEFDKAQALNSAEPRSRYFEAMWLEQHGHKNEALERWIKLANDGAADAPWQADLRNQISKTAKELGVDVSARLKNSAPVADGASPAGVDAESVKALPPGQQQAAIDDMVEGLSERLKSNPGDVKGWVMLLRSRMVLGQSSLARQDLVAARKALAKDAAGLAKVNEAAAQNGVPGA